MDDTGFQSITGVPEMTEPGDTNAPTPPTDADPPSAATASTTTSRPARTSSPIPSREASPIRPERRSNLPSRAGGRSRKNSAQDPSPTRSLSATTPTLSSAAAARKALSSTTIPHLYPSVSEPIIKAPTPQKAAVMPDPRDPPRWPVSPRLRSPPPLLLSRPPPSRPGELDSPAGEASQPPPAIEGARTAAAAAGDDALGLLSMRAPASRGANGTGSTLETVQEISQPSTPALGGDGVRELSREGLEQMLAQVHRLDHALPQPGRAKSSAGANESGSDSAGNLGEMKMRAASAAAKPLSAGTTTTAAIRGKASAEGSTKNMTVETETVSSIPQVAVGGGAGGPGANGSLRAKPSAETIRPRKEKRKTARKAPSVTAGVASSKADIFEAKIASAVDEANSSDSEETFVYESNPPDVNERPRRYHSRTPSATSMASQVDQRGNPRAMHGVLDGVHGVAMKKSMKFANPFSSTSAEATAGDDDGKGTARSSMGTGRGTTHHHHIGRWGRNGGNGHPSLFDNESPFPNATRSKAAENPSRTSSRPSSPRVAHAKLLNGKKGSPISSGYDVDDGARADDERTPLMISTVRSGRSGRGRRQPLTSIRQLEHQEARREPSFLNRFAGCLVLSIMILLVVSGAIGFLFATAQPLTEVKVLALKHVVATAQELILDMEVTARNPNIMVVSVEYVDVDLFAKSKHVESESEWWRRPRIPGAVGPRGRRRRSQVHARDDSPEDPHDDPDQTNTMLLGKVSYFNSPLLFDGSPFQHTHSNASGQLRLSKPGNLTEPGGSERWENVLKYDFDLILSGTLRYQLPMSQKIRSVSVNAKTTVTPSQVDDPLDGGEVHIV